MSEAEKKSILAEARFPVIVLSITMLAPIVVAIGLVIWKTNQIESERRQGRPSDLVEEVPAGSIRLTVTAPGLIAGHLVVSRLDAEGQKERSVELEVRSGLARGDLDFGEPPLSILIESEAHEARRLEVRLRRVTVALDPLEDR
ncbi:MAG: hypothetical protein H6807_12485 [Planctomycetes bacterium]|nr:hypothetical protein [Planctomycetota bacterium]